MAALITSALLRGQPDRRLVALAADGSRGAFEALVERYRRPLQAYCRRLLLPREAAEDVVQAAFLALWQALDEGKEIRDPRAWLYRCAHNGAVNALRRSGYRYEELSETLQGAGAPEEDLERRIAVRRALAGLAALPELQREALLRTAVEGESHEAVARELGLSEGAMRGLVYRARATLRGAMGVLTPAPLVAWAAAGSRGGVPIGERVAEMVAGGGTAGMTAVLAKGGTAVVATGAIAGGAAVVATPEPETSRSEPRAAERRATSAPRPPEPAVAAAQAAAEEVRAVAPASRVRRRSASGDGDEPRSTRGTDSSEHGSADASDDSSNSSSGSASSGSGTSDSSGHRSSDSGSTSSDSGSSGSGSGDSGDSSGHGSGEATLGDSTSAGSGSSGSGSGTSGSGDRSGPGSGEATLESSGSSGSGSGSRDSSGSGSGDDDDDDASGSG